MIAMINASASTVQVYPLPEKNVHIGYEQYECTIDQELADATA